MIFRIIIFIAYSICLFGQTPYNHRLDLDTHRTRGKVVHELDDRFICIGRQFTSETPFNLGIYVIELSKDHKPEILNFTTFDIDSTVISFGYSHNSYLENNSIYFLSKSREKIFVNEYNFTTKELSISDTLFPDIETTSVFLGDFKKVGDLLYVSCSIMNNDVTDRYVYIYNIETGQTDYILLESPMSNNSAGKIHVEQESDEIVIFGKTDNYRIHCESIDHDGEVNWTYTSLSDLDFFVVKAALKIDDGQYLLSSTIITEWVNGNAYMTPIIMKFDSESMTMDWIKRLNSNSNWRANEAFSNILPSVVNEDEFIYSGSYSKLFMDEDSIIEVGVVGKITGEGDVLWQREYNFGSANGDSHFINDMIIQQDSSYLCYGTFQYGTIPSEGPFAHSWLLKINENGELISDTSTSINWNSVDFEGEISLHPNPINNVLYINQSDIGSVDYKVYDISGKLVDSFSILKKYNSIIYPTDSWPSGSLFLVMESNGIQISSCKLLKN